MKRRASFFLLFAPLLWASTVSAATLVWFDIDDDDSAGGSNANILAPETLLAGVSGTNLSLVGTGMTASTGSDTIFVTFANAPSVSGSHYVEFTLTPSAPGQVLNFTGFNFEYYYDGSGSSVSGDAYWDLRANFNGAGFVDVGANPDAAFNNPINGVPAPLPSASVALTAINVESAVFRLNIYDDGGTNAFTNIKVSSITVEGSVSAIPEPSAFAVLTAGGALALAGLRRRRRA